MRVSVLSGDEVQSLLTALQDAPIRNALIIRLMLQCGLRCGEVSTLRLKNVWRGGYINPAISLSAATTKSKRPRYIDMPDPVRDLVSLYIDGAQAVGLCLNPDEFLFTSIFKCDRLRVSGIERMTKKLTAAAIGRPVHPHVLRHTFATQLLRHTNVRVVQQMLGHASLTTTEIYTHPTQSDCKEAVNRAFTH